MKKSTILLFILLTITAAVAAIFLYNFSAGFMQGLKSDIRSASLYNNRGLENEKLSQFGSAADNYLKAIELDPTGETGKAAYGNLMSLSETLKKMERPQPPPDQSEELFSVGINHFDEAVPLFKQGNYAGAKNYLNVALQIFTTARTLNPDNRHAHGFIYLTKGVIYYLCAAETIKFIKPTDTNYTAMVHLRRAYYPLMLADAYYKLALGYLTEQPYEELIKGYQNANDYYLKNTARKFLPQVDYWAKAYMANVKQETECVIRMDRINDLLVDGKYKEAADAAIELEKEVLKLKDSDNANNKEGFYYLNLAYARLAALAPSLSESGKLSSDRKTLAKKYLDDCSSDIKRARFAFKNAAYIGSCDNLAGYVNQLKSEHFPG